MPPKDFQSKKQKTWPVFDEDGPIGLEWNGEDYSCAYDTLFTILYDIWAENPRTWTRRIRGIVNEFCTAITKGFAHFEAGKMTLEDVRDGIRSLLHAHSPDNFPWGQVGASVSILAITMLEPQEFVSYSQLQCTSCEYEEPEINDHLGYALCASHPVAASTSKWIQGLGQLDQNPCPQCMSSMTRDITYKHVPSILCLEYPEKDIKTSHKIVFTTDD